MLSQLSGAHKSQVFFKASNVRRGDSDLVVA